MQDKIIAAIADWIDENEGNLKACAIISDHKDEIAEEIYKAIAPLVEAGEPDWKNAPEWAEWRIFDEKNNVAYSHGFPSENTQMQVPKDFGTTQKVERRPQ